MKLRQKTWLIVGTALVSLPMIFFGAASTVLLRGFSALEEQFAAQNVERVLDALTNEMDLLDGTVTDWGHWDDTYNFALDRNLEYLASNFSEEGNTLFQLRVNLIVILDAQNQVLFAQRGDLDAEEVIPISEDFLEQLDPYLPLFRQTELDGSRSGIVPLEEGRLLVASRPILTTDLEGPIQGTMLMGRFLNASELKRLEALTSQPEIILEPLDSPQRSADFQIAQERLTQQNRPMVVRPLSRDRIAGYALLESITGEPLLVVRVAQPRSVYAQGQASLWYLLLATAATAAIFGGITVIFLEQGVLSRLRQLNQRVNHIGATHDLTTRVCLTGQDELTELAQTINWTMDQLQQVQQSLKRTSEALAASNAELQQFAYVASHDLQAPLRKIESFGQLLEADYSPALDEGGKAYLQRIQNSTRQMRELIQALLDLARVTTQSQPFKAVDLTEVLHEVIGDLTPQIQQLGAEVSVGSLPTLEADPIQMRQLFQNLIGNALKFHNPGESPMVSVSSQGCQGGEAIESLNGKADEERYQIAIADNGIGFDETHQDRIFKIFQRLHTREEYEGAGIGLAICAKIVKRHHGEITASSPPAGGATFAVTLPIGQPKQ